MSGGAPRTGQLGRSRARRRGGAAARTPAHAVRQFLEEPAAAYAAPLLAWRRGVRAARAGRQLGRYEIVRRLGRGATATVYLARDPKHRRSVALKVLHPELAAGGRRRALPSRDRDRGQLHTPTSCRCSTPGPSTGCCTMSCRTSRASRCAQQLRARPRLPRRRCAAHRARGRRRARLLPPPRRGPSRHQAREHPARRTARRSWPTSGSPGRSTRPAARPRPRPVGPARRPT